MNTTTVVLLLAVFFSGAVLGVFVLLIVGILSSERRMSLRDNKDTLTGIATRRVLGVYDRNDTRERQDIRR